MNDDVQKYIYRTLTVFIIGVAGWVGFILINACGFSLACKRGAMAVERTPIPTLIPATLPASNSSLEAETPTQLMNPDLCRVSAVNFIGAWAVSNAKEADPFYFVDVDGKNCEAAFADVQALFTESKYWHSSALSCISCHSGDLTVALAQLDLSSYAGIMAGSRREAGKKKGTDILGNGDWKASLLYDFLTNAKVNIPGHEQAFSADAFIFVGKPFAGPLPTPTP